MEDYNRRRGMRFSIYRNCVIQWDGHDLECRLGDISAVGAFMLSAEFPPLGTHVTIHHLSLGSLHAVVTRHAEFGFGIAFEENEEAALYALKAITLGMTDGDTERTG